MPTRREARERALSLAYECEIRELDFEALRAELAVEPDPYAVQLLRGISDHHEEIDALLRLGTYELEYVPDVPTAAAITEAVELARQYSTKDSGRFVNALLSRIAEEVRP